MSKRHENGDRRRLHIENFIALYCSLDVDWIIKSRRLKLAGHIFRNGEGRSAYKILTGKPTGRRPLEGPSIGKKN